MLIVLKIIPINYASVLMQKFGEIKLINQNACMKTASIRLSTVNSAVFMRKFSKIKLIKAVSFTNL